MSRRRSGRSHRKQRLAAQVAAERGWRPATVSAWLRHRRRPDEPAPGPRAPGDAARGVPGRRPDGRRLARGAARVDRGALVPAFYSWSECEPAVRAGPPRQLAGARAWTAAVVGHACAQANAGPSARPAAVAPSTQRRECKARFTGAAIGALRNHSGEYIGGRDAADARMAFTSAQYMAEKRAARAGDAARAARPGAGRARARRTGRAAPRIPGHATRGRSPAPSRVADGRR